MPHCDEPKLAPEEPTLEWELHLWRRGYRYIAGLDEVGRGAWAGPVFAAAVVFPAECPDLDAALAGVRDSKQLSAAQRVRLVKPIRALALGVGVGHASYEDVDRFGIVRASFMAMRAALDSLGLYPDYLLIDAFKLPDTPIPQEGIIKGDCRCLSIAAASIIAKVARDRVLDELDGQYPGYGFAHNKGYGTAGHRQALGQLGLCPIHRKSWRPARELLGSAVDDSGAPLCDCPDRAAGAAAIPYDGQDDADAGD
jgi:ribonuclease HII